METYYSNGEVGGTCRTGRKLADDEEWTVTVLFSK
jgi:hypothetical protein